MSSTEPFIEVVQANCLDWLENNKNIRVHLTFLDPPFRQGKTNYKYFNDSMPEEEYWQLLKEVISHIYEITEKGGAIYFLQREKNAEYVFRTLRKTGWTFQNMIVWKKWASAVPSESRFSKQYQIMVFATKGRKPRVFNRLRIDYPPMPWHKYERKNGIYVTDVWDDIRELTSGYFAGDEVLRDKKGNKIHLQQLPVAFLLRVLLASTLPGDTVLDPFAGSGTTLVVAKQLKRNAIGIEIDPEYVRLIKGRLKANRRADNILKYLDYYRFTCQLDKIWAVENLKKIYKQRVLDNIL